MGLVDDIKKQVNKSGANKGKFLYFKPGNKIRVRFLQDMEEGMKVLFHDSYSAGINLPCQELFDKRCKYCEDDELRHRDMYLWSVWDYEAKEVKVIMGAVNNCSPIPQLVGFYESYGTLMDRDYVITKNGQGTNATFSVVPQDKVKFRNEKAKPFSESKVLGLLEKAFPDDSDNDEDDDEPVRRKSRGRKVRDEEEDEEDDEDPRSRKKNTKSKSHSRYEEDDDEGEDDEEEVKPKSKGKRKPAPEDDDEEDLDDEDDGNDYDDMTAVELYKLCKKKGIKVEARKKESYYISKLEAFDADEDDEEDEW